MSIIKIPMTTSRQIIYQSKLTSIQVSEDVICISSIFFSVLTYKSKESFADCS